MALASGLPRSCSVNPYRSKLSLGILRFDHIRFDNSNANHPVSARIPGGRFLCCPVAQSGKEHVLLSVGKSDYQLRYGDDLPQEPFWFSLIKDAIWGLKSLVVFLFEQPGQLKYIEWPSFQSTLKTASLSLILVALFIVILSSVDSVLCYLLALLLRRSP
ncbi:hypothetical protein K2173_010648 [Erythroxylum novogranatense]|uniref:Uncharacterized protein n=1 Tax=Erythroxylum novogranatense TaxID=1862640 RepID=A0AAV8TE58_9ROSI|nr:hypothetical protein K2173_010648 [Erythroxylum novogranatense]